MQKSVNIFKIQNRYIDIFIKIYHRSTHLEKILIFNYFLKSFNSNKTITFFYKLNDSEHNNQIRMMAFQHLQNLGKYVKLRKKFKGKKKDISYRQHFTKLQSRRTRKISQFKFSRVKEKVRYFYFPQLFDKDLVKSMKNTLNFQNLSCYYDWTSDQDFLKEINKWLYKRSSKEEN